MKVFEAVMLVSSNNRVDTSKITKEEEKLWKHFLKKFEGRLLEQAVGRYICSEEQKYDRAKAILPGVGVIVGYAQEGYIGKTGDIEVLAQQQWELCAEIYEAERFNFANRYFIESGMHKPKNIPQLTTAAEKSIRSMGGAYKTYNAATDQNLTFARKEFIEKFLNNFKEEKLAELENSVALLDVNKKQAIEKAENLRLESIKSVNLGEGLFNHVQGSKIRPQNCDTEADMVPINR